MRRSRPIQILLIEDEEFDVRRVVSTLKPVADTIEIRDVASNGRTALDLLRGQKNAFDVVIMDFQISDGLIGEELIREIKGIDPSLEIIVITKMTLNSTDFDFANSLLSAGAYWYCTKYPGDIEKYIYQPTDFILSIVTAYQKRLLQKERQRSERKLLHNAAKTLSEKPLIGSSSATALLREQIERCAATEASVLISGYSGTGKEVVAYNIHYRSKRNTENFVAVNCGSLPDELIESELFGYEKGAFTGADTPKQGLFEIANGGSLFLDEIGELPLSAQVKLLRVLQEGEIEKIGRRETLNVDVRIIAATNKDLEVSVREGRFREDLYYRLNVVPIHVPPLRQRPEDIIDLFQYFLQTISLDMGVAKPAVDQSALALLRTHSWPGNVRELKNVVQRLLLAGWEEITDSRLRESMGLKDYVVPSGNENIFAFRRDDQILPWKLMERSVREQYFAHVRKNSGSDAEAAKKLGLAPSNYHRMCKEMGLK